MLIYIITGGGIIIVIILIFVIICITHKPRTEKKSPKSPMITEISAPTLIHSSSALPGILKPADSSHLYHLSGEKVRILDHYNYLEFFWL